MSDPHSNHLWRLLWDYDPNGLIVVDANFYVKLVNPAFCTMFQINGDDIIGQPASTILDNMDDFQQAWDNDIVVHQTREYPSYNLFVKQVVFSIEEEGVIACIMVDFSYDLSQRRELQKLKRDTIRKVNEVVDHQMKVVQEIAGLLGETTAETKVSLLKIIQMLEKEVL